MGWFDTILQGVGSIFGSGNAGNLIGDLINVGGRLYTMQELQAANDRAAALRTAGLQEAAGIITDAYGNAVDINDAAVQRAISEANASAATASGMYAPYAEAGTPALGYYQQQLGRDPYRLSPQQAIEYDDAVRRNAQMLGTSGLRGSGRAVAAVSNDLQNRTRAGMIEQNRAEQRDAASKLLGVGAAATGQRAGIEQQRGRYAADTGLGGGRYAANAALGKGQAQAAAAEGSSVVNANKQTANAELGAEGVGGITGITASGIKAGYNPRPYYNDRTGTSRNTPFVDQPTYGSGATGGSYGMARGGRVSYASGGRVRKAC